jgi:N-acetylneuraminate epimerase
MFAGQIQGDLVAAGGANFPDKPVWEGGTKTWTNQVYALSPGATAWRSIGQLPRPLGYGGSATLDRGLLCFGGSDATAHYADCFILRAEGEGLRVQSMAALPAHRALFAWAMGANRVVYVMGGSGSPTATVASAELWCLQLGEKEAAWQVLPPCPGPARILATMASLDDGSLILCGGATLKPGPDGKAQRTYLADAWHYSPTQGWSALPEMPTPLAAAPCPAPVVDGKMLVLGGDDGSQAAKGPRPDHPGFGNKVYEYDLTQRRWTTTEGTQSIVTCPTTVWQKQIVRVSGEPRPGVRTPTVTTFGAQEAPR